MAQPKYAVFAVLTGILFSYLAALIPKPWKDEVTVVPDASSQQVGKLEPKEAGTGGNNIESPTSVGLDQSSQTYTIQMIEGAVVQPLGRYAPFSISKDGSGLLISAVVRSLDGRIVAEIRNNAWALNPNNYFRKNFDRSALEVIDEYGIPVLQVEYFGAGRIKLGGIFYLEAEETSAVHPDFPSTPKGVNPRAVMSFHNQIVIMGKGGYLVTSKQTSADELRKNAGMVNLTPWFDYSKPGQLGIRKRAE